MNKYSSPTDIDEGIHRNSDLPISPSNGSDYAERALRRAAVLIPLARVTGEWHILFIRRALNQHDRHSGQVAFPGGAMDDGDQGSPTLTALRETNEEIGISSDLIQPLIEMQPYITISNYEVTPVAGIINWPVELTLQQEEVSRAFTIPLSWLSDRSNFTLRPRDNDTTVKHTRPHPVVVYQDYDGEILWGATARMTLNFLQALKTSEVQLPA